MAKMGGEQAARKDLVSQLEAAKDIVNDVDAEPGMREQAAKDYADISRLLRSGYEGFGTSVAPPPTAVKTGVYNGQRVVMYSDGTIRPYTGAQ
jgi:hypothetical protein